MARQAGMVAGALLACCGIVSAMNPSLDIDQYAHTAWTIREGFFKDRITAIAQTPEGYLWLGTEFGLLRFDGVRSTPWQPPAHEELPGPSVGDCSPRAMGLFGLAPDRALRVGRTAN